MVSWKNVTAKETEAIGALFTDTDRAAAIVAASIVEDRLTRKLKENMRSDEESKDSINELFRSSGPLGTFSTKIHLGFVLRLYGKIAYRDLQTIKNVRNKFAHEIELTSFKTEKIAALCRNLKIVESYVLPLSACPDQSDMEGPVKPPTWEVVPAEKLKDVLLKSAADGGTSYSANHDKVLADPKLRFIHASAVFMSHFSFGCPIAEISPLVPYFLGDEQIPEPDKSQFPATAVHVVG
jgi:DNA-binding MltR family transcriptional regulator